LLILHVERSIQHSSQTKERFTLGVTEMMDNLAIKIAKIWINPENLTLIKRCWKYNVVVVILELSQMASSTCLDAEETDNLAVAARWKALLLTELSLRKL
jgi:hypothetical protein